MRLEAHGSLSIKDALAAYKRTYGADISANYAWLTQKMKLKMVSNSFMHVTAGLDWSADPILPAISSSEESSSSSNDEQQNFRSSASCAVCAALPPNDNCNQISTDCSQYACVIYPRMYQPPLRRYTRRSSVEYTTQGMASSVAWCRPVTYT